MRQGQGWRGADAAVRRMTGCTATEPHGLTDARMYAIGCVAYGARLAAPGIRYAPAILNAMTEMETSPSGDSTTSVSRSPTSRRPPRSCAGLARCRRRNYLGALYASACACPAPASAPSSRPSPTEALCAPGRCAARSTSSPPRMRAGCWSCWRGARTCKAASIYRRAGLSERASRAQARCCGEALRGGKGSRARNSTRRWRRRASPRRRAARPASARATGRARG